MIHHTESGMFVNRSRYAFLPTIPKMDGPDKKPTKKILWENVLSLMEHHHGKENLQWLARETKIGPGSASRIKEQKTSVGLDVLDKISHRFTLTTWQLLVPGLDPSNPPVFAITETEKKLYAKLKRLQAALADDGK